MDVKYANIFLATPSKFTQIWISGLKIYHLATRSRIIFFVSFFLTVKLLQTIYDHQKLEKGGNTLFEKIAFHLPNEKPSIILGPGESTIVKLCL
jgi:hypothetical protein